ncbi:hypothetical protein NC653_030862 [Populus alba x Populus x berolinensis]|uniref:Uncharacterized protein n=1 Tax=Populus alba x Populus x berolinensis TaxID=444605 RepID=A0AAD6LZV8_9ROSI|nr:hypothetical protein NC653_030862 [Populus alba x Populus x berolinensis]
MRNSADVEREHGLATSALHSGEAPAGAVVPFCHLHKAPRREPWEVKINRHFSLHKACDQGLASCISRREKEAPVFTPWKELDLFLSSFHGHGKPHVLALLRVLKRWAHHIHWKENNTFEGQQAHDPPGLLLLTCACWCRALY